MAEPTYCEPCGGKHDPDDTCLARQIIAAGVRRFDLDSSWSGAAMSPDPTGDWVLLEDVIDALAELEKSGAIIRGTIAP